MASKVQIIERHTCEHGHYGWHGSPVTDRNDPYCPGGGAREVPVDWSAAADEFEQLSVLNFDPDRAVRAILIVALGAIPDG